MAKDITHGPITGLDGTVYTQDPDRQGWIGTTPKRSIHPTVVEVLGKLAGGEFTVNQAREALGLPPVEED